MYPCPPRLTKSRGTMVHLSICPLIMGSYQLVVQEIYGEPNAGDCIQCTVHKEGDQHKEQFPL